MSEPALELGRCSISLAVRDLGAAEAFYAKLGFTAIGGDPAQGWRIVQNDTHLIGLFQGMFDRNIITFNPGTGAHGEKLQSYTDIRDIQRALREQGLEVGEAIDGRGPGSFMLTDPDGNQILFDQHV